MRHRIARIAVVLFVVLMVLGLPGCRKPFPPQAISADLVPEDVRAWLGRENISDVVWHVSKTDWHEGLSLYAATYTRTFHEFTLRCWWVHGVKSDPLLHGATLGVDIQDDEAFSGQTGGGKFHIYAGGYCFDSHATEVVAKTTEGREFRCPVTNGFWLIVVSDRINESMRIPGKSNAHFG